jgi:hypothetical protein
MSRSIMAVSSAWPAFENANPRFSRLEACVSLRSTTRLTGSLAATPTDLAGDKVCPKRKAATLICELPRHGILLSFIRTHIW